MQGSGLFELSEGLLALVVDLLKRSLQPNREGRGAHTDSRKEEGQRLREQL